MEIEASCSYGWYIKNYLNYCLSHLNFSSWLHSMPSLISAALIVYLCFPVRTGL